MNHPLTEERPSGSPAPAEFARRRRRLLELGLLFGLAPWLVSRAPRGWVLPAILAGGAFSFVVLWRDPTFSRAQLGGSAATRAALPTLLLRTALVAAALLAFAWATSPPESLFSLPRQHRAIWVGLLLLYPVFSVYPQELMYRTLFFHRYGSLFATRAQSQVVNALLFGWGHVMIHRASAMLLATVGGWLIARTFLARRTTLPAVLEHSLYGSLVLTVGVGGMFVNGSKLLAKLLG